MAGSASTRSDLFGVEAEVTPKHLSHALLFAATDVILLTREAASVTPGGRQTVAAVGAARPLLELVRMALHGTETRGIDCGADAATVAVLNEELVAIRR
jgi:hypothetical protein